MRAALHHLLEERAHTHEGDAALTYGGDTRSYAELWDTVARFAVGLAELGVRRDDRVAVFLEKRLETVESICGVSAAGGVFVPINPLLKPQQVAYILDNCGVRVLVTTAARLALLAPALVACPTVERVVVVDDDASRDGGTNVPLHSWTEVTSHEPAPSRPRVDLDMAAILYTSGSTGLPKGVVLTPSQPDRRGGERQPLHRQHGRRRDPLGASVELRRRLQPADDRVQRGRTRRPHELPHGRRRRTALRTARGHRPDLRAAAVDPDRQQTGPRRSADAPLLRQHGRPHAEDDTRQARALCSRRHGLS